MHQFHLHAVLLVEVVCQVFCRIDRAVLSASAPKGEHQIRKPTLQVALHMRVGQCIYAFEECQDFSILFQEVDDGLVQSCEPLVRLVPAR